MKKIILLIGICLLSFSCSEKEESTDQLIENGNLSEIKARKAKLSAQQSETSEAISQLDKAIKKLDKDKGLALVSIKKLQDSVFNHFIELPGDVETDQNIVIYPQFSGTLLQVNVKEGDHVQKGQVLARIDDGGLSSQLAEAEVRASLAQTTFERQGRLWDQKIGSEIEFLQSKANYEAAQNSVKQLKSQVGRTIVTAPYSGIIDEVFSDPGEAVSPGQNRLFRLINLSKMYIKTAVPEAYLEKIKPGTPVQVEIASSGTQFETQISQVGNFINPGNRTFDIKIEIPQGKTRVKPNLIATVKINDYSAQNTISIPENVLQENASGGYFAYVVKPENDSLGTTEKRLISTGNNYAGSTEIKEGLQAGELLIVEGAKNVHDGEQVKYEPNSTK